MKYLAISCGDCTLAAREGALGHDFGSLLAGIKGKKNGAVMRSVHDRLIGTHYVRSESISFFLLTGVRPMKTRKAV